MDKERSERIKKAMAAAGHTRDSLALATGYSTGTISNIKAGKELRSDQLIAICSVLQVSPNYILGAQRSTLHQARVQQLIETIKDEDSVLLIESLIKKLK